MQITCMQKPGVSEYRLVSRRIEAAKVFPMKGRLTSAFVFFIRREYTIHASSKKTKTLPERQGQKDGNTFPAAIWFILADLSGSP